MSRPVTVRSQHRARRHDRSHHTANSTITQRTSMTRSALFFVSASLALASANAAATGADATCDAALDAHNSFRTDCVAVSGACPASCLASFEALETSCVGKKYSNTQKVDGVDVEVALDWNTDKATYLQIYQHGKNLFGERRVLRGYPRLPAHSHQRL